MSNSFFNKLTSSLNIQKEGGDDATDFYQALDDAQAQEGGQEESAPGMQDEGEPAENGSFADLPGSEVESEDAPAQEDMNDDEKEEEEEVDDAEPAVAHLAMAKSGKSSVRERAHRMLSPMPMMGEDDAEGQLAIDVYQTDSEIVIKSVIAGVQSEDLDITIGDDTVTIRGSRKKDEQISNENYYYQECYWGSFSTSS
jgi:HSP20 family molecular chaperone IbpA